MKIGANLIISCPNCKRCGVLRRNKAQYLTEADALKAMTFIWSRDPSIAIGDLHVYDDCPCCKFWHIGHKDDRFEKEK